MKNLFSEDEKFKVIKKIHLVKDGYMPRGNVDISAGRYSEGLVYVIQGSADYLYKNYSFSVSKGDIFFLPKGEIYSIIVSSDIYKYICIDFDVNKASGEIYKGMSFNCSIVTGAEKLFRKILKEWILMNPGYLQACHSILYNILSLIIRGMSNEYTSSKDIAKLSSAISYIHENINTKNISVAYLARLSKISEVHFRRLFKKVYSVSPNKYIINLRINSAKELLGYKSYSISKISEALGFENQYYFSYVFKRETGLSPSEYRELYGSDL